MKDKAENNAQDAAIRELSKLHQDERLYLWCLFHNFAPEIGGKKFEPIPEAKQRVDALVQKHFGTLGALPTFPAIAAMITVPKIGG